MSSGPRLSTLLPGLGAELMKVTVNQGIRCVHGGTVVADGASADVPDEVGRVWVQRGWCSEVKLESKVPTQGNQVKARR